jgi:uncharacterized Zn finger protein (UPF0148 family)
MARFRLRFLLQEFDLPPGETILGRSPDCHVTIEDPLVSRQHARVYLQGDQATVEDLGSRNGVRVNGRPIKGQALLADGDRLRIGTQELVFCQVKNTPDHPTKRTGFLRHCARCGMPYPEEMGICPTCGATDASEEETISGLVGESKQNWSLQLMVEVIDRALSLHRPADAQRLLSRATSALNERIDGGEQVDRSQLDALSSCAARLAEQQGMGQWLEWSLSRHAQLGQLPPPIVIEKLLTLPRGEQRALHAPLQDLIARAQVAAGTESGASLLARYEEVARTLEGS